MSKKVSFPKHSNLSISPALHGYLNQLELALATMRDNVEALERTVKRNDAESRSRDKANRR